MEMDGDGVEMEMEMEMGGIEGWGLGPILFSLQAGVCRGVPLVLLHCWFPILDTLLRRQSRQSCTYVGVVIHQQHLSSFGREGTHGFSTGRAFLFFFL